MSDRPRLPVYVERQSARVSKITNDGLTRSGTRCFVAVAISQRWASKGQRRSCIAVMPRYTHAFNRKVKCNIFSLQRLQLRKSDT